LAGGSGTNQMAYSLDGIHWTANVNSPFSNACKSIAWNGIIWVAGGIDTGTGHIAYSYDGIKWTQVYDVFSTTCWGVAWNGSTWIAVGEGTNRIAYSFDGFTWVRSTSGNTAISSKGYAIAWNGGRWVAGGVKSDYSAALAYSDNNGVTWSTSTNPFTDYVYSVVWNGSVWLAGGSGGHQVIYSHDGASWTPATGEGIFTSVYGIAARRPLPSVGIRTSGNFQAGPTGAAVGVGAIGDYLIDTKQGQLKQIQAAAGVTISSFASGFSSPQYIHPDSSGNIYVADTGNNVIKKITPAGTITTVAGNGTQGFSGDGGQATSAKLNAPQGAVLDSSGNLYIADTGNSKIRKVTSAGIISTIANAGARDICVDRNHILYITRNTDGYSLAKVYYSSGTWNAERLDPNVQFTGYNGVSVDGSGTYVYSVGVVQYFYSSYYSVFQTPNLTEISGNSVPLSSNQAARGIFFSETNLLVYIGGGTSVYEYSMKTYKTRVIASGFTNVFGLCRVGNNLYVVDSDTNSISKIVLNTVPDWRTIMNVATPVPTEAFCVIVGQDSRAPYSYDGVNWITPVTQNTTCSAGIATIAWNGSYWMSSCGMSSDGINWVQIGAIGGNGMGIRAVAWNGSYWVAVGIGGSYENSAAKSYDGINWTTSQPFSYNSSIGGLGIAWGQNKWVAVGSDASGNCIATSIDGINWTYSTNNPFYGGAAYAVAWNGRIWVAVGTNNGIPSTTVAFSYDGINWNISANSPLNGGTAKGIAWNGTYWVVCGTYSHAKNSYGISYDGNIWIASVYDGVTANFGDSTGVAWNGDHWIGTGVGPAIRISYDGLHWTPCSTDGLNNHSYAVASRRVLPYIGEPVEIPQDKSLTESFCVAGGTTPNLLAYTYDGLTWSSSASGNQLFGGVGGAVNGVAWNGSIWVAVGDNSGATVCIATSSDGINWVASTNNPFSGGKGYAVAWNGSYWVAAGYNYNYSVCISTSLDGMIWTPSNTSLFSGADARCIAWNGSYWIAGGTGASFIAISYNGTSWTPSNNNPLDGYVYGTAWNGAYWVAVGSNNDNSVCIAKSYDGMNWINSTDNPFSGNSVSAIAWNGAYWVAVGANNDNSVCMAKSYDGMTWTSSSNNPFNGGKAYGISWNGSLWVTVGINGSNTVSIATSPDGMNWTSTSNVFPQGGGCVAARRVLPSVGTKILGNFQAGPTGPYARGGVGDYYIDTSGQELYKFYTATGPSGPTGGWTGIMPIGSQALYTPADPSKWASTAPTTVQQAIDRMAALLYTLNSDTAIP
jgi:hypothetical protein